MTCLHPTHRIVELPVAGPSVPSRILGALDDLGAYDAAEELRELGQRRRSAVDWCSRCGAWRTADRSGQREEVGRWTTPEPIP